MADTKADLKADLDKQYAALLGPRQIDKLDRPRKKDMKVLVLSPPRTDTASLGIALRKLGYSVHAMRELLAKPSEMPLWIEATQTTLLSQSRLPPEERLYKPYGRAEFDKLLDNYEVAMDVPSCMFAKELIEAYPEAKVILTLKDYDKWEASMQNSIWALLTWKLFVFCRILNVSSMAHLLQLLHLLFQAHNGNNYGGPKAKEAYEAHNETVRKLVPKDRLLEIESNRDWDKLCNFLGQEVPEDIGRYPIVEEGAQLKQQMEKAWWNVAQFWFGAIVFPLLGLVVGVLLFVYQDWQAQVWPTYKAFIWKIEVFVRSLFQK